MQKVKAGKEEIYVGGLVQVDCHITILVALPVKSYAKIMANNSHKVYLRFEGQLSFKLGFNLIRRRIVNKIVHKICEV